MASFGNILKNIGKGISKYSPTILAISSSALAAASVAAAVYATPKALDAIERDRARTPKEVIRTTWKYYIPAVALFSASVVCTGSSIGIVNKRTSALHAAVNISEASLANYKLHTKKLLGEKEKIIRDGINEDYVQDHPVKDDCVIDTGFGKTLCLEETCGQYFYSDIDKIKSAINRLNERMLNYDYVTLNELYSEYGIKETSLGNDFGWDMSRDGLIELRPTSCLTSNGRPCLVLDYDSSCHFIV